MFLNIFIRSLLNYSNSFLKIRCFSSKSLDSFSVLKKPLNYTYERRLKRRKDDNNVEKRMKEYKFDDITSLAHDYLDEHREIREYYRKIAWELPTLTKFSMKYEVPGKEDILKFRYTTYLGEKHPAESKVTMEVLLNNLGLSLVERHKLIVLSGPRYNPLTDVLKFNCELFPERDENKKYLNEQLKKLIEEAKDLRDTFEDIPQDFRHVKSKTSITFPKEWIR
ncbi:hypothetical protein PNEG_01865 [Pneumocystis murina B123]|uniref:Small ribosomal subunit protein mS35 mitochondrial conserved domain-containing protein n=1 Tax=Pneumocystis murina (strain B123) TaxID=1069680 RepID=M7NQZ7_PNEMU|nr:hypothetical protein PNEG_01865 [Pneumocystis murina B123]EMR09677.1 hypothetical protein PNEG_01865 [Pneumocystis murina B123]